MKIPSFDGSFILFYLKINCGVGEVNKLASEVLEKTVLDVLKVNVVST